MHRFGIFIFLFLSIIGVMFFASFAIEVSRLAESAINSRSDIAALRTDIAALQSDITVLHERIAFLADATKNSLPVSPQVSVRDEKTSKEIAALQKRIEKLSREKQKVVTVPLPTSQQSREELLTSVVARVTPAVVSIVIAKDVPLLESTCMNPFGDDPFFRDVDFCVPAFRQKGVQRKKVGAGTGFFVTVDGFIITNRHVVQDENAEYTVLLHTGEKKTARVAYRDVEHDIAILDIDGSGYSHIKFGNSSQLKLGQTVIAIGNALGEYNNSVSEGIISGLNRTIRASTGARQQIQELSGVIQTSAAINPGNSGGPLLTLDGAVIGVNVATVLGSNNISFAIPSDTVRDIIKSTVNL